MNESISGDSHEWRGPMLVVVDSNPLVASHVVFKHDLRDFYGKDKVKFCLPDHNPGELFHKEFGGCIIYIYDGNDAAIAEFLSSDEAQSLSLHKVLAFDGTIAYAYPAIGDLGQDEALFFYEEYKPGQLNVSFRHAIGAPLSEEPYCSVPISMETVTTRMKKAAQARLAAREPLSVIDPEVAEVFTEESKRFEGCLTPDKLHCVVHEWPLPGEEESED